MTKCNASNIIWVIKMCVIMNENEEASDYFIFPRLFTNAYTYKSAQQHHPKHARLVHAVSDYSTSSATAVRMCEVDLCIF